MVFCIWALQKMGQIKIKWGDDWCIWRGGLWVFRAPAFWLWRLPGRQEWRGQPEDAGGFVAWCAGKPDFWIKKPSFQHLAHLHDVSMPTIAFVKSQGDVSQRGDGKCGQLAVVSRWEPVLRHCWADGQQDTFHPLPLLFWGTPTCRVYFKVFLWPETLICLD